MKRRQAIVAAVGFSTVVAGCSGGQSDGSVDLTVISQSETPYTVEMGFFRDEDTREDSRAYTTTLDIEAGGKQTRDGVVSSGRYLVRYSVYEENSRLTDEDHVHYIPSENDTDGLVLDIQETGELTRR